MKKRSNVRRQLAIADRLAHLDERYMRKDGYPFGIGDRLVIIEALEHRGFKIVPVKTKKEPGANT
jgi:hypothetical protein